MSLVTTLDISLILPKSLIDAVFLLPMRLMEEQEAARTSVLSLLDIRKNGRTSSLFGSNLERRTQSLQATTSVAKKTPQERLFRPVVALETKNEKEIFLQSTSRSLRMCRPSQPK